MYRVVIIGGGFGGLYAARALEHDDIELLVLDRTNHHLFQPLLYQVATATLAPTDITAPIRWLLRKQRNATVLQTEVQRVDPERRVVIDVDGREFPYDFLIVAAGARHAYFGHPEWETTAPGLKNIDDAIRLRHRILSAFEKAELADDLAERNAWLTFVIVGGGPTGVELAGMLPTITKHVLHRDFRRIAAENARVILLEGGSKVLPSYPDSLAEHARLDLTSLGVEVRTNELVTNIESGVVRVGKEEIIRANTIIWAAGNAAAPLGASLGAPIDRAGRVIVAPDLSVSGHPEIFAIGDMASVTNNGRQVPGVAPAAMQMGQHTARNIRRTMERRERLPFLYRNKGDLATIGRHRAIADFGRLQVTGGVAWLFWLFLHILYLAGFRNRLSVLVEWGTATSHMNGARVSSRHVVRPTRERATSPTPHCTSCRPARACIQPCSPPVFRPRRTQRVLVNRDSTPCSRRFRSHSPYSTGRFHWSRRMHAIAT